MSGSLSLAGQGGGELFVVTTRLTPPGRSAGAGPPGPRDQGRAGGRGGQMRGRADAEPGHQLDVLAPPVVVVVGHVGVLPVADRAGLTAEDVPDRLSPAVLVRRSLDLVRGRGHAPGEAAGEARQGRAAHPAPAGAPGPAGPLAPSAAAPSAIAA